MSVVLSALTWMSCSLNMRVSPPRCHKQFIVWHCSSVPAFRALLVRRLVRPGVEHQEVEAPLIRIVPPYPIDKLHARRVPVHVELHHPDPALAARHGGLEALLGGVAPGQVAAGYHDLLRAELEQVLRSGVSETRVRSRDECPLALEGVLWGEWHGEPLDADHRQHAHFRGLQDVCWSTVVGMTIVEVGSKYQDTRCVEGMVDGMDA